MGLRDIGDTLPPGFRFHPSDEELVCHYLYKKIANEEVQIGTLEEIDLHICEPWQLPDVAKLNSNEWYFFSFRDRKYATGFRTNRATTSGYWKATGKDRSIVNSRTLQVVGMRKTLVFYKSRAPNGIKSGWIMHEFRVENPNLPPKEDWVLCRVFHKSRGENYSNKFINSPTNYSEHANMPYNHLHQNFTSFSHQQSQALNPSTSLAFSHLDTSYTDMARDQSMTNNPNYLSTSHNKMHEATKCDQDEYGFLLDLVGSNALPLSLGDLRYDDENGSVFI
ncbi:hypothetical protein ACS0TY_007311 [Phlomoides rotata]